MNASAVKTIAKQHGADLCGIAPVARFRQAPEGFHPVDIYSECRSVIVPAKPCLAGSMRSASPAPYTFSTHNELRQMDRLVLRTALSLEMQGIGVVPIPPDDPYLFWEASRTEGRGILSLRHAAHLAGLGVLGKNTLLKNVKYGSMVRFGAILADIHLEGDPITGSPACPEDCTLCMEQCPSGALDGITVNQQKCRAHTYTNTKRGHSLIRCHVCRQVCPDHLGEKRKK